MKKTLNIILNLTLEITTEYLNSRNYQLVGVSSELLKVGRTKGNDRKKIKKRKRENFQSSI